MDFDALCLLSVGYLIASVRAFGEMMEHLEIQISGKIQSSNFHIWKDSLLTQIHSTNLDLVTDTDFVIASDDAKALKNAEKNLKEAKVKAMAQTEEIQSLFSALDEVSDQARQARLTLERQIRAKKQDIKSELIDDAIEEVHDYIASKPEIFSSLDNSKHLQRHHYEGVIKGKSTITSVQRSLNSLVQDVKGVIDSEYERVVKNFALIEAIPPNDRLLFQDLSYLITLPENELHLTIENRIVKLSEQNARNYAANVEKELNVIDNEALNGVKIEQKNSYVISVEILSSRHDAINVAREIKKTLNDLDSLIDIRLTKKRDI